MTSSFKGPVVKTRSYKAKAKNSVVKTDFQDQVKTKANIFARTTRFVQLKEDEDKNSRLDGNLITHSRFGRYDIDFLCKFLSCMSLV